MHKKHLCCVLISAKKKTQDKQKRNERGNGVLGQVLWEDLPSKLAFVWRCEGEPHADLGEEGSSQRE